MALKQRAQPGSSAVWIPPFQWTGSWTNGWFTIVSLSPPKATRAGTFGVPPVRLDLCCFGSVFRGLQGWLVICLAFVSSACVECVCRFSTEYDAWLIYPLPALSLAASTP